MTAAPTLSLVFALASGVLRWFLLFELALLAGSAPFWVLAGAIEVRRGGLSNLRTSLGRRPWRRDPWPTITGILDASAMKAPPAHGGERAADTAAADLPRDSDTALPGGQAAGAASAPPTDFSQAPPPQVGPDQPQGEARARDPRGRRASQAKAQRILREALPALSALPDGRYYAFEALITEEDGAIDQLLIGLDGLTVIHARPEPGYVLRRADGTLVFSTDAVPDYRGGRVRGNFAEFDDDLDELVEAQVLDVQTKLPVADAPFFTLLCFPNAQALASEGGPAGFVSVLDLVEVVSYQGAAAPDEGSPRDHALTPDRARDLARAVGEAYARDPWLLPSGHAPGPFREEGL
jgi:hypothetical protein